MIEGASYTAANANSTLPIVDVSMSNISLASLPKSHHQTTTQQSRRRTFACESGLWPDLFCLLFITVFNAFNPLVVVPIIILQNLIACFFAFYRLSSLPYNKCQYPSTTIHPHSTSARHTSGAWISMSPRFLRSGYSLKVRPVLFFKES